MNKKGIVLPIAMVFVLGFTLLGLSGIRWAGMDQEYAERSAASARAFWLADGAAQKAKALLPVTIPPTGTGSRQGVSLGGGTYSVDSALVSGYSHRWTLDASGSVLGEARQISGIVARHTIEDVLNTEGTVNGGTGCHKLDCGLVQQNMILEFSNIFNGISLSAVIANADHYFTTTTNWKTECPFHGVSVLTLDKNIKIVGGDKFQGDGVLIVRSDDPAQLREIEFNAGEFTGILWVVGDLDVAVGNPIFRGAVFIDNGIAFDLKLKGDAEFYLDIPAIEAAIDEMGANGNLTLPRFIAWQEV